MYYIQHLRVSPRVITSTLISLINRPWLLAMASPASPFSGFCESSRAVLQALPSDVAWLLFSTVVGFPMLLDCLPEYHTPTSVYVGAQAQCPILSP